MDEPSLVTPQECQPIGLRPQSESPFLSPTVLERITWSIVALGVALRVARYLMNYPLWWDEAFVGANLLRRGYMDLLRPLDFGQVCPLLFVWIELTAVKLLGFSEMSLRLFPLICGIASLLLFRHVAGRVLTGVPRVLAVAILAVAFHPIRHAADVKPYSSDLLVSLVLLALLLEWRRTPRQIGWLWAMAAFAPIAVGLSYPAAFVAGGLGVAMAWPIWRSGRLTAWIALVVFHALTVGTFMALFFIFTHAQAEVALPGMQHDWAGSFPPIQNPFGLILWAIRIHAGSMLAYPIGGPYGASTLTLIAASIGLAILWRARRLSLLAYMIAPLGVAFVAASMKRYPYGGSARFMLYSAPAVCLLAGLGAAAAWNWIPRAGTRLRAFVLIAIGLTAIGIVPVAGDTARPYRSFRADKARRFARQFWPSIARDGEPACLIWDFGIGRWNTIYLDLSMYLCNQKIYCPPRQSGAGPRWDAVSATRPLRCVLAESPDVTESELQRWLNGMREKYELRARESFIVEMAPPGAARLPARYTVFEFIPKSERRDPERPSRDVVLSPHTPTHR